ncbi:delta-12 fatty acid desaturase protein [Coprinopsis marcescibilis]|uniref:Delta-12 fatty acid desaturase protein n=1 Tax=Coprinopsis marcescibilis TaxID=230819 RepID=A0A5C3KP04_COPMA|nr:delta-12 fatty acid desaturase protein [Coprinopsis marcescibilis]
MHSQFLNDAPEYQRRVQTPFAPTKVTLAEIQAAVPKRLFGRSTFTALMYVFRDILCATVVYKLGWQIAPMINGVIIAGWPDLAAYLLKCGLWGLYWYTQGIILAGWWCLAHEAGHGTLSPYPWVNHVVGFSMQTFLLAPYFAWRSTHRRHHKATSSVERDENYVPRTRSGYGLPSRYTAIPSDYHEVFEDAPVYTLLCLLFMQALGWQYYLLTNVWGNPSYPPGTNHFNPSSPLFKPNERNGIIASNVGLAIMAFLLYWWGSGVGPGNFFAFYFVPYILANHWIVIITYLQHTDPTIPHYRREQWTFLRGALSTVDRPLLGWVGRFFLHNVCHDHIAHHIFSSIPFYNQPQVTEAIKKVLGDDYIYDSTNTYRSLYRNFTQCCLIEDDGDILFYKNEQGRAARDLLEATVVELH